MPTLQKSVSELKRGGFLRYCCLESLSLPFIRPLSNIYLFTIFLAFFFQLGTLGAGNHYAEIQVVDEIYDKFAANKMGIEHKGQVCIMIHSGSRGFGHQVATGMFVNMRKNQPERN